MTLLVHTLQLIPTRRTTVWLLGIFLVLPLFVGYFRQRWNKPEQWVYSPMRLVLPELDHITAIPQNSYDHTEFFKPLRRRDAQDYCESVSQADIADLAQTLDRPLNHTIPVVYHFQGPDLITSNHNGFPVGSGFCSIAFVPQTPFKKEKGRHENQAVNGTGPDQLHAELASPDVRLMITQHPEYWGMVHLKDGWFDKMDSVAVYAISFNLYQPGDYWFKGEVEFKNYDWLMEDWTDFRFVDHKYDMLGHRFQQLSPPIAVTGAPVSRPTVQCFTNGFDDMHGRWYRASSFNNFGNMTALNPFAMLEYTEHAQLRDGWGWTFAPDACELAYYAEPDHAQCFENKVMHVTGDSNSRRLLKSLIGGGEHWCPGEDLEDRWCQCEDYMQYDMLDVSWKMFEFNKLQTQLEHKDEPFIWGRNTTTFFDFVGGVVNPSLFNGWPIYYSGKRFEGDNTTDGDLSIAAKRNERYGVADIVYISMVTWDVSGVRTPAETLAILPEIKHKILNTFPESTKIVMRLANAPCCGNTGHRARFGSMRMEMWNAVWQQFFAEEVRSGRVRFIDPTVLQGRFDAETDITCTTSHLRVSHVRFEQMMWMNAVCEHAKVELPPPKPSADPAPPPPLPPALHKLGPNSIKLVNGTFANGTALPSYAVLAPGTHIMYRGGELLTNETTIFKNGTLYDRVPHVLNGTTMRHPDIPSVTTKSSKTSTAASSKYTPSYTTTVRLRDWRADL